MHEPVRREVELILEWIRHREEWSEELVLDTAPTLIYSGSSRGPVGMTRGRAVMSYPRPGIAGVIGPVSDSVRAQACDVVRTPDLRSVECVEDARTLIGVRLGALGGMFAVIGLALSRGAHREWATRAVMDT